MPWRPVEPGEVPTLGYEVLEWMTTYLATPDRPDYEPFVPTREQAQFVINFYAIDPYTGRRRFRRGVISRPKGWGHTASRPSLQRSPAPRRSLTWSQRVGTPTAGR